MKDEEIDKRADDFVNAQEFTKVYGLARKAECGAFWKYGFLAGLKAGRTEWHDLKDKLPPSGETVLLYFGTDIMGKAVLCTGCVDCRGEWYKNVDREPIKWQEIVLPKESE